MSGLSVRTIQRIERGRTPSVESLKAIASVFEVDFTNLREPEMETTAVTADANGVNADEALALRRVRKIRSFYMHLVQYCAVIIFLTVVNLLTNPHYLWVIWPAVGWGVAVLMHGVRAFDKVPFLNGEWEKRQVEKYLGRKL